MFSLCLVVNIRVRNNPMFVEYKDTVCTVGSADALTN